jgi:hypothetical protein
LLLFYFFEKLFRLFLGATDIIRGAGTQREPLAAIFFAAGRWISLRPHLINLFGEFHRIRSMTKHLQL